jgi:hypothetical protein
MFEGFAGLNTNASRPGIEDAEMYWCDGFMPIAKRNLRTLPGVGTAIRSASTIVWFGFGNIGVTPYMIDFLANGSVNATNTIIGAASTVAILPPGTISSPSIVTTGLSQWGREYIIIVADQTDGYWLWNGDDVFTAGTLAPLVTITGVGSAYAHKAAI